MSTNKSFIRRRPVSSFFILIGLLLCALIWTWRVQLQAFPSIISAYTAKEYCSCRYVMNNPAEYCQSYVKQWVPGSLSDDSTNKLVSASGMGRSSSARWQGQREGCQLLPDQK